MKPHGTIREDGIAVEARKKLKSLTSYHKIRWPFRYLLLGLLVAVVVTAVMYPLSFGLLVFTLGFFNYLFLLVFRLSNVLGSSSKNTSEISDLNLPADLPLVSIVLPLKNEGDVIKATIDKIEAMDYPAQQKELYIVVEKTDLLTRRTLRDLDLPVFAQILLIPEEPPFTKARALMHALPKLKGRFLTVYDAESRPEPDQFRKAISVMAAHPEKNLCLQSKIKISNQEDGWIARNFAVEYYEWYELHLKELSDGGYPFGLGGNSFFVETDILRKAGGWDPYNVTEDAELSVRLRQKGVEFKILESYTAETCPDSSSAWINQRTRWNKGLMVTQFVHFFRTFKSRGFPVSAWVNFWMPMVCNSLLPFFNLFIPIFILFSGVPWVLFLAMSILLWGILIINLISSTYLNKIVYKRLKIKAGAWQIFLDVIRYLVLHLAAGFKAYGEYFYAPLYWHKTHHEETEVETPVIPIHKKDPVYNYKT